MTEVPSAAVTSQSKVDPETLALRGSPARVTRFRRGAIIAISGVAATFIAGAAWLALKPVSFTSATREEDRSPSAAKPNSDVLAGAPSGYGDVAKLGPPLPGDLGRPILARQRELEMATPEGAANDAAVRAAEAAEAERQRAAAQDREARESGVWLARGAATSAMAAAERIAPDVAKGPEPVPPGSPDANGQLRKNAMIGRANDDDGSNPHRLVVAASPWTLQAGSILAASLITGLNSDLPGIVTAQITENAYDSATGRILLVPQGSRLIGSYDSVVAFGQSRALVVWQRIILPDGSSIRIDNMPASDTQGYAGLADRVDRHTWQLLKGVVLSTLLGVGTELGAGSSESDLVRAIREAAQQSGSRAGDQIVARNLEVQPTLKVRPGWPLRIVVHKDLILRPWGMAGEGS